MPESRKTGEIYQGKIRVRACGILLQDQRVLLIKHRGLGTAGYLWSPPGGGVLFGEGASAAVRREFLEETGLDVVVGQFLFVNEYRNQHHHAVELFFEVANATGKAGLGQDPELPPNDQILEEIKWFSGADLKTIDPKNLHNAFAACRNSQNISDLRGFFKFEDISIK